MNEESENFGEEPESAPDARAFTKTLRLQQKKPANVTPFAVFELGKWVLGIATAIFVGLALIRMFYRENTEAVKEVWEYSRVVLNSIVSLVLGLYFGSKYEAEKETKK